MKASIAHFFFLASFGRCFSPSNDVVASQFVLQDSIPPLDSPPFTPSSIRPKKIGYFWTGAGDKQYRGKYLADLRSPPLTNLNHCL